VGKRLLVEFFEFAASLEYNDDLEYFEPREALDLSLYRREYVDCDLSWSCD